jgi:predicted outer membrane repeat protein
MTDCVVKNNSTETGTGGGICAITATISGNSFVHNNRSGTGNVSGSRGGGIYAEQWVSISDSKVYNNTAKGEGGGIYAGGLNKMDYCRIYRNIASEPNWRNASGGGIYINSTYPVTGTPLTNNFIYENQADSNGCGIYVGGGIHLVDCEVCENTLTGLNTDYNSRTWGSGCGIFSWGNVIVDDCFISGNETGYAGGGIYAEYGLTVRNNSKIKGNTAITYGGGLYAPSILLEDSTVTKNNFQSAKCRMSCNSNTPRRGKAY